MFNSNDNLVVQRLNANGSIDTSFASGGKIDLDLGENEDPRAIAIDYNDTPATNPDYGKIVIVGHQATDFDDSTQPDLKKTDKMLIVRYLANGKPDTSFNGSGVLVTTANDGAKSTDADAVTIESGGQIVVAGTRAPISDPTTTISLRRDSQSTERWTGHLASRETRSRISAGNDYAQSIIVGGFGQQLIVGGTSSGKFGAGGAIPGWPALQRVWRQRKGHDNRRQQYVDGPVRPRPPTRQSVAAGGPGFDTAAVISISVPNVSVSSLDPTAGPTTTKRIGKFFETIPNPASMIVAAMNDCPLPREFSSPSAATPLPRIPPTSS